MNTVTISSKYQVVIPRQIREQFNLKPGNKLMFIPYNRTLRVVVVPPIEEALGMFEGIDTDPQREKSERPLWTQDVDFAGIGGVRYVAK